MATVEFRYDPKNTAWFTANAAMVLKAGEPAYHDTTGLFKLGDGVTALSALSFLPTVSASTPTIQQVLTAGQVATTTIETTGFIKTGGTFGEFLKADGSVDNNYYLTFSDISASTPLNYSNLTGVFSMNQSSALSDGYLSSTDWSTFNGKQDTISLTTTGSSGAATLIANVLNVPNYTLAGLGGTTLAAVNAQNLSVFAATTSSQLAGVISDETGSGALVFGTSPSFTTSIITPNVTGVSGNLTLTNAIQSSGAITQFTFTNVANTNQTLGTNIPNFRVTGANKQWATGALATQYFNYFTNNTIAFVGASTATDSYNTYIESVVAGTNATLTRKYSLGTSDNVAFAISNTAATLHLGVAPSASNYMLSNAAGAGSTYLNAPTGGFVVVSIGGANRFQVNNSSISFNPVTATATNATTCYTFAFSSNTNQTLSTEISGVLYNNYSRQWATGNITTQREQYIKTVTYTAIGASVITNAFGKYIEAPTASTNITITNNYAAGFGGNILINTGAGAGRIRSAEYSSNLGALYFNQTSPDGSNYAISGLDNANTLINGKTTVNIRINGSDAFNVTSTVLTYKDAFNIAFNATTGTKIGTGTTQKLSFWNATPIVQPTTAVAAATVVSGAGGNVKHDDTFDGYTVEKVVRALRNIGLLA